ncbi:DMT family transporter [Shouchella sp. 1P09AA]|uniref:DMT family transporter n=1 Tax=unclassified Shouchella TaxID=2893065 RepID=UPI00399F3ED4
MRVLSLYLLGLIAGISLSIEAALGGALGQNIGKLESTYYIFIVGALSLFIGVLFFGKGNLGAMFDVPKWNLTGGILGATYLSLLIISVSLVGVGLSITVVIIGQLVASVIIDHFGWLGSKQIKIDKNRLFAVGLLVLALFFIF